MDTLTFILTHVCTLTNYLFFFFFLLMNRAPPNGYSFHNDCKNRHLKHSNPSCVLLEQTFICFLLLSKLIGLAVMEFSIQPGNLFALGFVCGWVCVHVQANACTYRELMGADGIGWQMVLNYLMKMLKEFWKFANSWLNITWKDQMKGNQILLFITKATTNKIWGWDHRLLWLVCINK